MGADTPELLSLTLDDFTEFPTFDSVPMIFPGVYVFSSPKLPLYVGESGSVAQRIRAHRRKPWYKLATKLHAYKLPGVSRRLILETAMIFRLHPRHNRAIKIGISLDRFYPLQFVKSR